MGARTQMIIECVNHDGTRESRAYHFQWGAGRPMFLVLMNHLTKMCCSGIKRNGKLSDVAFPTDLLGYGECLNDECRREFIQLKKSIKEYKQRLNESVRLDEEIVEGKTFRDAYLEDVNGKTRWMRNERRYLYRMSNMSMDNMSGIRKFLAGCDNNNGALIVRFSVVKWDAFEKEWNIDIMILKGREDNGERVECNNPVSLRDYMQRYPLCTEEFIQMVEGTLKYYDVNIIVTKSWKDFENALMDDAHINEMYNDAKSNRGCKEYLLGIVLDYVECLKALPDSSPDDEIDYQDFGETLRNYCE